MEEGYEVAFRIGTLNLSESSKIVVRPLRPYQMIVCAAPAYLEKWGTPKRPSDLERHQCLGYMHSDRAVFSEWQFTRDEKTYTALTSGKFRVNDAGAQLRAAEQGLGVLLGAQDLVADSIANGKLVQLLTAYQAPWRPFHLLYPADRQKTMKLRRFIDAAMAKFG